MDHEGLPYLTTHRKRCFYHFARMITAWGACIFVDNLLLFLTLTAVGGHAYVKWVTYFGDSDEKDLDKL